MARIIPYRKNKNIVSFINFCVERENIRRKKAAGKPPPWTNDRVLQLGHFCNVRRSDDRVTKWIGEWLISAPKEDKWFWCCIARWFNEPATLSNLTPLLQFGWLPKPIYDRLCEVKKANRTLFRSAYIITGAIVKDGKTKHKAVVDDVLTPLWRTPPLIFKDNCEASWLSLRKYPGQGAFMAGQIVADWNTFGIINGLDTNTWATLGPGSARGLYRVYGQAFKQKDAVPKFIELRNALATSTDFGKTLTLMDVQNCLCEYHKYCRGYTKMRYVPHREQLEIFP